MPFPKGTDFHKLFVAGKSVQQPVDKTKKEECKRAYTEHYDISSEISNDHITVYTERFSPAS